MSLCWLLFFIGQYLDASAVVHPVTCSLPLRQNEVECRQIGAILQAEHHVVSLDIESRLYNSSDLQSKYDVYVDLRAMKGKVKL
jgi:hypothetical protein